MVIHARASRSTRRAGYSLALVALVSNGAFVWMLRRPPIQTNIACDRATASCTLTRAREAPSRITYEDGAHFDVRKKEAAIARAQIVATYCPVLVHANGTDSDLGPFCIGAGKGQVEALRAAMKKIDTGPSASYSSAYVLTDGVPFFAPTVVLLIMLWLVFFLRARTFVDRRERTVVIRGGSPRRINFDEITSIEVKERSVLLHLIGDLTEPLVASGEVRDPRATAESVAAIVHKPVR